MSLPDQLIINGVSFAGFQLVHEANRLSASDRQWEKDLGEFLKQWLSDDASITVFTSGSTGAARPIRLKKQAMIASAQATLEALGLQAAQQALLCLSCKTIAGMMMTVRAMVQGFNLITTSPDGNPLKYIAENLPIDFAAMVPTQVYNSLNQQETKKKFGQIGTVIIGGGEISPQLENQFAELSNALFATFGMTETISHIALRRLNGSDRTEVYTALPGVNLSADERGCLIIEAPALANAPVVTNDIVKLYSSKLFRWLGRYDHVINRGGRKLIPEEIEKKIRHRIPYPFFVAGVPDNKYGEVAALVVEAGALGIGEAQNLLKDIRPLCHFREMPQKVIEVASFVTAGSGKINRLATLKSLYSL